MNRKNIVLGLLVLAGAGAFAEDWGFSFSGILQQVSDNVHAPATLNGEKLYSTSLFIRLYNDSEEAATSKDQAIWGRKIPVMVKDGQFTCELKDSAGTELAAAHSSLVEALAAATGSRLSIGVTPFDDTNAEITPRQLLSAAPFAAVAGDARGTLGDISVPGTLTVGAFTAGSAVFADTVRHSGTATFSSDPKLPKLTLSESEPLEAPQLESEEAVSVSTVETANVSAGTVTAKVETLVEGVVSNLSVKGAASVASVRPVRLSLKAEGDASCTDLSVTNLVFGSGVDLFQWEKTTGELTASDVTSAGQYKGDKDGKNGEWTVPAFDSVSQELPKYYFLSLSVDVGNGGSVSVKVDDAEVATLSAPKGWQSFQVFLKPGQKFSWSSAQAGKLYFRRFRY